MLFTNNEEIEVQKLRSEVRQEQIAQAALNLVASRGMSGLNMVGLAREVGLVPSAIYRHFKSKGQVLDAVLDLVHEGLASNVREVQKSGGNTLELLRQLFMLHIRLIQVYQALPRILFSDEIYGGHPERKAKLHQVITSYLDEVAGIVRQGQQNDQIRRDISSKIVAVMFLGLIQPLVILFHLSDGGFDVNKHIEGAWPIFVDAIKVR